ncbi:ShlB/FhaC/HecB family hemolysin secretion/activation protein [Pseudomonas sp. NPDC089743]|uniref:ShlB/FhaC/HecB family hemolysin secretion/activation protein n=1 Tax=Pseudomonas sp. NPDC089743 TaxID=3364471 RepID=UPI00381BF899
MRLAVVPPLLLTWASLALAEPLPAFLDTQEYERRLPTANLPVDTYRPVTPALQVVLPTAPTRVPSEARFVLHKVRFEGGTVYPLSELREHYQTLIGHQISVGDLQQFTERLTQRYQHDGYPLSYAYLPPQDFAEGRVQVVLVEGYIKEYELLGDIGPSALHLKQMTARLLAERPLSQETLERYVGAAQRIPGINVKAEVVVGRAPEEANRLRVRAWHRPVDAGVTLSDGSRGGPQALFKLASNGQTRFAEQLAASFLLSAGGDHVDYQRLDYSQPLDAQGSQLLLAVARYRSEPRTRVRLDHGADIDQRLESERYSVGLGQPLMIAPNEWVNVAGRFYSVGEHIEYRSGGLPEYDSSVRALSFEGDWRKADHRRLRIASAGVYQGMDYLGARSDADYDMDFLRFRIAGLQSDQLSDNWQSVVAAAVHWSDDRLPESERAAFGGQHFGRGYPSDQAAGDKGWGVAYELNYSIRPGRAWLQRVQPYAVLDAAHAWYNGGPFEDAHLSSVALGVRLAGGRYGNVALEVAKPLADVALDSLNRGPRLMLSVSYQLD